MKGLHQNESKLHVVFLFTILCIIYLQYFQLFNLKIQSLCLILKPGNKNTCFSAGDRLNEHGASRGESCSSGQEVQVHNWNAIWSSLALSVSRDINSTSILVHILMQVVQFCWGINHNPIVIISSQVMQFCSFC